jgi:purine-binding chemotaxis protein CheW
MARKTTRRTAHPGERADAAVAITRLRERLRRSGLRDASHEAPGSRASYLTVWIGGDEYALPLARALEVVRCEAITEVPNAAVWLRGVMSVRGSVVPIVDLAPRMRLPASPVGRRSCVLLIDVDWRGESATLGLLVEAVGRVLAVDPHVVEPVPSFGTRLRRGLLVGLIPAGERFALVLDVDRALSADELAPSGPSSRTPELSGSPSSS